MTFPFSFWGRSAPLISAVSVVALNDFHFRVTWTTNIPATSKVDYGTTISYGSSTTLDPTLVTSHSVDVGNADDLHQNTLYHCRPVSGPTNGSDKTVTTTFTLPRVGPFAGQSIQNVIDQPDLIGYDIANTYNTSRTTPALFNTLDLTDSSATGESSSGGWVWVNGHQIITGVVSYNGFYSSAQYGNDASAIGDAGYGGDGAPGVTGGGGGGGGGAYPASGGRGGHISDNPATNTNGESGEYFEGDGAAGAGGVGDITLNGVSAGWPGDLSWNDWGLGESANAFYGIGGYGYGGAGSGGEATADGAPGDGQGGGGGGSGGAGIGVVINIADWNSSGVVINAFGGLGGYPTEFGIFGDNGLRGCAIIYARKWSGGVYLDVSNVYSFKVYEIHKNGTYTLRADWASASWDNT